MTTLITTFPTVADRRFNVRLQPGCVTAGGTAKRLAIPIKPTLTVRTLKSLVATKFLPLLLLLALPAMAAGGLLKVTSALDTGDDATINTDQAADEADGNGLSLREALDWATDGDTIRFDLNSGMPGDQGGTISLGGTQLFVDSGLTINGDVDGDLVPDVTISGANLSRIFYINAGSGGGSVRLVGLIVCDGYGGFDNGGGIYCNTLREVSLQACIIKDNRTESSSTYRGGGLYSPNPSGKLFVSDTTFSGNTGAARGGAVSISGAGPAAFINCTISSNRLVYSGACLGGGIFANVSGALTLINTTISGNSGTGTLTGGGIYRNTVGSNFFYNSTIVGNATPYFTGGLYVSGTTIMVNTVVAGNTAGAGATPGENGSPLATGGSPDDVGGTSINFGTNCYFGASGTITEGTGNRTNQGTAFLLLGNLTNNGGFLSTHLPQAVSALVDAGNSEVLPADTYDIDQDGDTAEVLPVDARGAARLYATAVDIGATEFSINGSPTDITLSNSSINESAGAGATVGTLSTTDPDNLDTPTCSLVSGMGDTNNASFVIASNILTVGSSALPVGSYSVRIQSDDGHGGTFEKEFSLTVVDDTAPAISTVSVPTNGIYLTGQHLDFTLNYSEAVLLTDTLSLQLVIGQTPVDVAYVSGSGSSNLLFRYTVQAGNSDTDGIILSSFLTVNGGTIRDAAGNGASLSFSAPSTGGILVDALPAQVVSITRLTPATPVLQTNIVVFAVTYSKAVTNVSANKFIVSPINDGTATGAVTSVTGGPVVYDVAVTLTGGEGDFRLDAPAYLAGSSVFAGGFQSSQGMRFDAAGNLFVADLGHGKIVKVTPAGAASDYATGFNSPCGLVFDTAGNLFVGDTALNTVSQVATNGAVTAYASGFDAPIGLEIDDAGSIYVANIGGADVLRVATNGSVDVFASGFNTPWGLAFGPDGLLYVANAGGGIISNVTTNGDIDFFAGGFQNPWGLAFDGLGNLFVANFGSDNVLQVTREGVTSVFASGFNQPSAVAFDGAGNLYVNNSGAGTVIKLVPLGITDLLGYAASGVAYTSGEAYTYSPNYAPTDLILSTNIVFQSALASNLVTVGTLTTTDANTNDSPVYSLVTGPGDTHNIWFTIASNTLVVGESGLPVGSYSVRIQTDDGNGGTFSKAFTITSIDDIPPVITSVSVPSDGTYAAGLNLDFAVNFDKPVYLVGNPCLSLSIGDLVTNAVCVSGNGSYSLLFRYTVQVGDSAPNGIALSSFFELNSGAIRYGTGIGANLAFTAPATTGVLVDAVMPQILSINRLTPAGQLTLTNTVVFAVTFSKPVANVSANKFVVSPINGGSVAGTVTSVTGGPIVFEVAVTVTGGGGGFRLDMIPPFLGSSQFYQGLQGSTTMGFDAADNLFVTETIPGGTTTSSVLKLPPNGSPTTYALGINFNGSKSARALAVDGAGNCYIGGLNKIYTLDGQGTVTLYAANLVGLKSLGIDSSSNLYVVGGTNLFLVTSSNNITGFPPNGFFKPLALACNRNGLLYVGDDSNPDLSHGIITGTIKTVWPDGSIHLVASGFKHPVALAFDRAGILYVADSGSNTVSRVTLDGVVTIVASNLDHLSALAIDSAGILYVNNSLYGSITKIAVTGITDLVGNALPEGAYSSGQIYTYGANQAPTDLTLSTNTVGVSFGANATVGTFTTTEPDTGDSHDYSLIAGAGDTNNASFVIVTNTLIVGSSPLPVGNYSVRIQTDDGHGGTYTQAFTITVVDDVAPTILSISRLTPAQQTVQTNAVVFTVTFSENVLGVGTNSFVVTPVGASTTTGAVTSVSGGPLTYDVTVNLTGGRGEFRLDSTPVPAD